MLWFGYSVRPHTTSMCCLLQLLDVPQRLYILVVVLLVQTTYGIVFNRKKVLKCHRNVNPLFCYILYINIIHLYIAIIFGSIKNKESIKGEDEM